jgi:hypothetical protein
MIDRLIWDELSLEILTAARAGMAVKDFEIQCRLKPIANGKSYFDRIRVAESLIQDKLIIVDDGYLKLSKNHIPDSLFETLATGSEIAWKILDCIDPPRKFIQKLDQDLLRKIGLDGELAVLKELQIQLTEQDFAKVRHVSLVDDSAGFDVQAPSVKNTENPLLLEIKTSVRPGDLFTFYISKNEARVARQNNNWFLIGVESSSSGFKVLGNLLFNSFSDFLPLNQSDNGEWETAKIVISKRSFMNGLP